MSEMRKLQAEVAAEKNRYYGGIKEEIKVEKHEESELIRNL